ncbi:MAG TPA: ferritin-like domain-containing protein [Gammaproteobacteria bacterium]|nr:ferritin-like domain-containing protein [Gammaproteobacteria bacterium]
MMHRSSDQRVLGYLGRALSLELSAVQQYSTQARLVAAWGLNEPAARLSAEATEEMGHVDRVISRMLALGVAPNASQLRPVGLGADLQSLLRQDQALERELVTLYGDAVRYCARQGDHESRLFFEALLEEEKAHGRELAHWLEQLEQPGAGATGTRGANF